MDNGSRSVVASIFRCIVRHTYYIGSEDLLGDLNVLRRRIRSTGKCKDSRVIRKQISNLYNIERSLRDIGENKLTVSQFRNEWNLSSDSSGVYGPTEKNQGGRRHLWLQHEARRFDKYNESPPPNSEALKSVDQMAKFHDSAARFARRFGANRFSPVVSTVLAPFWKQSTNSQKTQLRPRPVELRSIKRSSGTLSMLRVRGIKMRTVGLRRHIDDVDKDRYGRISQLDFQIWLAKQYMEDPLDGEDMSSWIGQLVSERRRLVHDLVQLNLKLEVQRRILIRRRVEIERKWEWRHQRNIRELERRKATSPKALLTLGTL